VTTSRNEWCDWVEQRSRRLGGVIKNFVNRLTYPCVSINLKPIPMTLYRFERMGDRVGPMIDDLGTLTSARARQVELETF